MDPILSVQDLAVEFPTLGGCVRAVDSLSFDIRAGETLAVVGESGSGKSTAALAILRLVPQPGRITSGRMLFEARDILSLDDRSLRELRGGAVAMVFQDPLVALNPLQTIGRQLAEVLRVHERMDAKAARPRVVEALRLVGLPDAERLVDRHPHNLSGGMRQRAMIAMALLCRPRLLIADEPTTALDVTVQAQVLDLIREMKARLGMAVLLITHDFGVVAETADRVVVMYAGRKVEEGPVMRIFAQPAHPYTRALLHATRWDGADTGYLPETRTPSGAVREAGCCFADRCDQASDRCRAERPALYALSPEHAVACFLHEQAAT